MVEPLFFELLAHRSGEGSVTNHTLAPHLHQGAGEEEVRRDTDQKYGCNED